MSPKHLVKLLLETFDRLDKFFSKVDKPTKKSQFKIWVEKHPITFFTIMTGLFSLIVMGVWIHEWLYPPQPSQFIQSPPVSIYGFVDWVQMVQLPVETWAAILVLLWLTKW